jgi:uncharacterized cupin superfamily protein
MYLSAIDIQNLPGVRTAHVLSPDAVSTLTSLGDAAGLQHLGVHMVVVEPGQRAGELHVHHFAEECVYVLGGHGTAVLGERSVALSPGDFLAFPANGAAHELINDGQEPLIFLLVGQRLDHDILDYPRLGRRLYRHHGQDDLVTWVGEEGLAQALPGGILVESARQPGAAATPQTGLRMVSLDVAGRPAGEVPSLSREAEEACAAAAALHAQAGFEPPWTGYLVFDSERCVGTCAFKSPPRANRVEIACYPFPAQEQHLEAMMASLMRVAFENHPGILVIAHTLAEEGTETAVLARLGFHLTGRTQDTDQGEVWEWMLQTATS